MLVACSGCGEGWALVRSGPAKQSESTEKGERERGERGEGGRGQTPALRYEPASSAWVGRNRKITPIPLMFSTSYTYTSRQCGAGSSGLKGFSFSWILFQSTNSVHFSLDKKCCGCIFSAKYQTFLSFMVKC